jgi:pimeloyl-ACP methyl ester carboxylesterase
VAALIDGLQAGPVHVVGHDWGGVVAWMLAAWQPRKVRTLTAVCAPHPGGFLRSAMRGPQALASWYIACFQIPGVAEWALDPATPAGRRRFIGLLRHAGAEEAAAERDADALAPVGLRGGLLWYRALPLLPQGPGPSTVAAPTLVVGSDGDTALLPQTLEMSLRYVAGRARLEILRGATHWIPDQAPDQLAALIARHVDR